MINSVHLKAYTETPNVHSGNAKPNEVLFQLYILLFFHCLWILNNYFKTFSIFHCLGHYLRELIYDI